MEPIHRLTFPNGVRVVIHERPSTPSAAIALTIAGGTRSEPEPLCGATHFAEHLLFKGTESRSVAQIAREIDLEGGQLNAWTSMDAVRLHTRVALDDLDPAMALIADMALGSTFPGDEVERERGVILEEIAENQDIPSDFCYDTLLEAMYAPHAIGRPILGTPASVSNLQREELLGHWHTLVQPANLILSVAGGMSQADAHLLAERYFGHLASGDRANGAVQTSGDGLQRAAMVPRQMVHTRPTEQVSFCVGYPGVAMNDPRRYALWLFDQILGGGMGSRLFQEIRERRGLAYTIGSSFNGLLREGYLLIHGGTMPERIGEVLRVVREEVDRLLDDGPTADELEGARRQAVRGLLLASEANAFHASRNSDRELYELEWWSDEELIERLCSVTAEELIEAARDVLRAGDPAVSVIGPVREDVLAEFSPGR